MPPRQTVDLEMSTPISTSADADLRLDQIEGELQDRLTDLASRFSVPGVAAGIHLKGTKAFAHFGVTSVANPLPVDPETLFQIGSNTKLFTATAIMRLVDE